MRLAKLALAAAFLALSAAASAAPSIPCGVVSCTDDLVLRVQAAPPPAAAPATQNTITTTAPVTSQTTISVGTYAGQALMWVASVFGTTIGTALTALFIRMLKNAGMEGADKLRDRLQEIIVNGLNAGARVAADKLRDKGDVEIKNAVVAQAVQYTQTHGADTLKALGIDPTSYKAVEAIKARIETAINDPLTPTPPVLDGANAAPVKPAG